MNWDEISGKWNQLKGSVRMRWGKLTDDDLAEINGQRDLLVGKLQERYGIAKEKAEEQINEWKIPAGKAEQTPERKVG